MSDRIEINSAYIEEIASLIEVNNSTELSLIITDLHIADIAEIIEDLPIGNAHFLFDLIEKEKSAPVLVELEDDTREEILSDLTAKEIAEGVIDNLESDDAADVIGELSENKKEEVLALIEDFEHASDISDLLTYPEDTAGGLMAKELIKVNENWTTIQCLKEMRKQAEEVKEVYTIYVVDDNDKLLGILSLRKLLLIEKATAIKDIIFTDIISVKATEDDEHVANIMNKYDLIALPVVDDLNQLIGRITIDDVMDVVKEEAEKDYQMAAGISQDVEADDSILELTKARLPWLVLGLFGGLGSVYILQGFEEALFHYPILFFFTPLIAAMAGNVGVQSSAIIVQGLANDVVKGSLFHRLLKELGLALINGSILGLLVILFGVIVGQDFIVSITIAISMLTVIIIAALIGTFVPIILDRKGIDPAIATGPFITTSNDIFGIFLFFYIAKLILGF